MDGLDKPLAAAKSQISFIDFVVAPLWRNLTDSLFPQHPMFVDNVQLNRDHFEEEVEKAQAEIDKAQAELKEATQEAEDQETAEALADAALAEIDKAQAELKEATQEAEDQ